jgi:hypothetical protein
MVRQFSLFSFQLPTDWVARAPATSDPFGRREIPVADNFEIGSEIVGVIVVCMTLRWRGESAANPSLNRRSDEFLESIKKGVETPAKKLARDSGLAPTSVVIKINFKQF